MRVPVLLLLSGCNQIYGLDRTHVIDGPPEPDGLPPLVVPPPGPTTCGAIPNFESWTYVRRDLPPSVEVFDLSSYADRAIVVSPNAANEFWDVGFDGNAPVHLAALDPPDGVAFRDPAMAPDGSVLWFRQTNGALRYAARVMNWEKVAESFGLIDFFTVSPGTPGFYDGTIRIPIVVQENTNTSAHIIELSSGDGRTWTRLDTVAINPVPGVVGNARMSADGCLLFFGTTQVIPNRLFFIERDSARRFAGPPHELVKAGMAGRNPGAPVLAADQQSIWFVAEDLNDSFQRRMFRGR